MATTMDQPQEVWWDRSIVSEAERGWEMRLDRDGGARPCKGFWPGDRQLDFLFQRQWEAAVSFRRGW